jgi:hypothetical protein
LTFDGSVNRQMPSFGRVSDERYELLRNKFLVVTPRTYVCMWVWEYNM